MASSASFIKPAEFGGHGRLLGPEETSGGLRDLEFSSRCPPDVQPKTRIVAVCGINNFANAASPNKDGWFISDFYLFHHLFRGAGASQLWMTCLDPQSLVDEYTEYAHGNRLGTRRIVLDRAMLPDVLAPGNIRVVPAALLCERFLSTVRSECRIAKNLNQPVLLLVFGHGDRFTFGIAIGGDRQNSSAPRLTIDALKRAIGLDVDVGILLTSCYSGGWVIKPQLNVTAMTAAGHKETSESWAKSESMGRASGSIYATAVLQALIKMEDPTMTQQQDSTLYFGAEDLTSSSTYAELSRVIYRTLIDDVDIMGANHKIKFSAQNDTWETEWRPRSGIPLNAYKERWDMLRSIPADTADPITDRKPHAHQTRPGTSESGPGARFSEGLRGGSVASGSVVSSMVESMAEEYLLSFPGSDSYGPNSDHQTIRDFVSGNSGEVSDDILQYLFDVLAYRLSAMRMATNYKNFLSLPIHDCHLLDSDAWRRDVVLACRQKDAAGKAADVKWKHYLKVFTLVDDSGLFDPALPDQGWTYPKPQDYLAVGLCESGMTLEEVGEALMKLVARKWISLHPIVLIQHPPTSRLVANRPNERCI